MHPFPSSVPSGKRRLLLRAAALGALLPAAYAANAELSLSTAINRTARFRALSQRCAKAYCQLYLDVLPDNARDSLNTAQRLMQIGFEDLGNASLPANVAKQILGVQQEATALNALLGAAPTKTSVASVSAQADKMLAAANKATEALEGLAKQSSAKLVNLAGRQRMLSQRLGKNYFLIAAGQQAAPLHEQMSSDSDEFRQALSSLAAAPISTPSIRNELALAEAQWMFFLAAVNRKPEPDTLRTVATTSERLLEVMNKLTNLYDAALTEVLGQA
jgi:hypothetical protein